MVVSLLKLIFGFLPSQWSFESLSVYLLSKLYYANPVHSLEYGYFLLQRLKKQINDCISHVVGSADGGPSSSGNASP